MVTKRGRKNAEEKGLNVIDGGFSGTTRPEPPADLTPLQAEIWRESCQTEPIDFFNTSVLRRMLKEYCCHAATTQELSGIINAFKPEWIKNADGAKRYSQLLKMRAEETRAMSNLATKLRLTNQSRYTPQSAATMSKNAARGVLPWEE